MWPGKDRGRRWWGLLALLGIGAMGYFMVRDLFSLGETVLRVTARKMPLTVENVVISRVFSGDRWSIEAPLLERGSGEVLGKSLDIRVRFSGDGGGAAFRAGRALLREASGDLIFWDLEGVASFDGRDGWFSAPEAFWRSAGDDATFPGGLVISTDGATLRGAAGTLRRNGAVTLWGRVSGTWTMQE